MDDTALLAATRGVRPDKHKATEQGGDAAREGKQRVSRKERMRLKKEAKLKAKQYGSDDEDLGCVLVPSLFPLPSSLSPRLPSPRRNLSAPPRLSKQGA